MRITGFHADADHYCVSHGVEYYGEAILTDDVPDREGNIVHPVFSTDDDDCGYCTGCVADDVAARMERERLD